MVSVPVIVAYGNEFEIGTYEEFLTGEIQNISVIADIGDGAIILDKVDGKYPKHGEYLSQIIDVPSFEYMVMSWNSDTPENTYVEVEARVLVNHFDKYNLFIQTWSNWLSWGKWSPFIKRSSASINESGAIARMGTDELIIKGLKGETASKVQLKVNLHTNDPYVTPSVRYLHGSLKNSKKMILKQFKDEIDVSNLNKAIPTPAYSQMITNPKTSNSICSPTTITMMLNRFGENLLPDEVAQGSCDKEYGFGNWTFATAMAGSFGYKSFVDYTTIEGLKREIYKGYPIGLSVRYTNDPTKLDYTYIEGSPGTTPGHLLVVRGFETIDGVEYILVNDSYGPDDKTVARRYKLEQLDKAWASRAAYIIHDKVINSGTAHILRIEARLVPTELANEYKVFANNGNINVTNFIGVIAYTLDNDITFKYISNDSKNSLTFLSEEIENPDLKVYVITDIGKVYVANMENNIWV